MLCPLIFNPPKPFCPLIGISFYALQRSNSMLFIFIFSLWQFEGKFSRSSFYISLLSIVSEVRNVSIGSTMMCFNLFLFFVFVYTISIDLYRSSKAEIVSYGKCCLVEINCRCSYLKFLIISPNNSEQLTNNNFSEYRYSTKSNNFTTQF